MGILSGLTASQRLALQNQLKYWRDREEAAREHYIAEDDVLEAKIASKYNYLYMRLEEQINAFYTKYASAEGIDMATAQQKVSKMDVQAFQERAKQYVEAAARMRKAESEGNYALAEQLKRYVFSDEANEALRLYNATMKINRLEMLKSQMGMDMVETFNGVQQDLGEGLDTRTIEELERQAGILGETVSTTTSRVDAIVNASFNNATWSQRIWMYQDELRANLSNLLTDGIIQGRNPRDLARELRKLMGGTKANTERLLRTEMARVQTAAQEESYKENGYDQYIFLALGTACPICKALDEQVFDIKYLEDNQFAPPVHPNCRCSTAAYADREAMERELFGEENSLQEDDEQSIILNTKDDPMVEAMGPAWKNNQEELNDILAYFDSLGVQVVYREGQYGYEINGKGIPGTVIIDPNASLSAWMHEKTHVEDDFAAGWSSMRIMKNSGKRYRREVHAYEVEMEIAKKIGREDMVKRLAALLEKERKSIYGG